MHVCGQQLVPTGADAGHGNCDVVLDDLFFDRRPYDPGQAYGQSKTAQCCFPSRRPDAGPRTGSPRTP